MTDKKSIHFIKLSFIYSFIIVTLFNYSIFFNLIKYFKLNINNISFIDIYFLILVFFALWFLLTIFLLIFGIRYVLKPLIIFLLISSSIIFYYQKEYGISVDDGIILSGLDAIHEGNYNEIFDLLGSKQIRYILVMGIIPSIPIFFFKIIYPKFTKELILRIFVIFIIIISFAVLIFINYKNISLSARSAKHLNTLSIPHYSISSIISIIKKSYKKNYVYKVLDTNPTTNINENILGVVVIGETARASNFSLNGYEKNTNPLLKKQNIINFSNASACGTLTKISVPCMFYLGDYNNFDEKKSKFQSNALDIAFNAGIKVLWLENNSSCKNVCQGLPTEIFTEDQIETYDEILLEETAKFIKNHKTQKALIVLHTMGSHGPKYYKRYPKHFEKFTPSCKINTPQDCTKDELINSYDNTILYTDYILNSLIEILKKENLNSFLIYASDHGESLGEKGLYLHGVPKKFAPKEQTHIPFFLWYSDSYKIKYKTTFVDPNKEITHEHFPHTILESLRVKSKTIKKEKSLVKLN